ncbi:MAG: ComEC/Rec2 family competence protein [Acidobacteria bacterium]|nr:ComEC/Rec2 family competence protein [Acidobacteriota bacterium]
MRRLTFPQITLPQQPLVFLALAFIAGLWLASRLTLTPRVWLNAFVIVWCVALLCWRMHARDAFITTILLCGFALAGAGLWALHAAQVAPSRVIKLYERGAWRADEPVELIGTLATTPEAAPDRFYLSLNVEQLSSFAQIHTATGAVQIVAPLRDETSKQDYVALQLDYGTRVRMLVMLTTSGGFGNPGAPQFGEMLELRGVDATGWVKSPLLIERLGDAPRNALLWRLYRWRATAIERLIQTNRQPAAGILAASLLGSRYWLDRRAAQTFREGGTFHLLVISGAHVAVIAFVLLWLARRVWRSRVTQYVVVIVLLWAYTVMVGAQPAITRATVMITIALLGQLLFRQALGANTLAASALVLLAWQPRDLFNPGFQLSFLTVLVIVALVAPLYERLRHIGTWEPTASTPYPPRVPRSIKRLAELLFWDERNYRIEMKEGTVKYRIEKWRVARWLSRARLQAPLRWVTATLVTTVCIQLALLPLMVIHFHRFSIVSPLTNVIESLLISALMIVGAAQLTVGIFSATLAAWFSPLIHWLGKLTVSAGEQPLALPLARLRVPDWGTGERYVYGGYWLLFIVLVVLLNVWHPLRKGDAANDATRRRNGRLSAAATISAILIISTLIIAHPFAPHFMPGRLAITFLDVGQGDAMLLQFPRGQTMVLDSGGRLAYAVNNEDLNEDLFIEDRIGIGEAAVMPYLWRLGLRRLDYIAATHADSDHVEAFGEITQGFAVKQALAGFASSTDLFSQAIRQHGIPLRVVKRGEAFEFDGVQWQVLAPFADADAVSNTDNNASLVVRVRYGQRTFLLTGDIERETEARLVQEEPDLHADVLKVAHHGSRTSSTHDFLARIKPQHAIISAADPSPYGHPHPEVVERLQRAGAQLWATGKCGAITFTTDGNALQASSFKVCH